jgi:acetyl esterase/lipase
MSNIVHYPLTSQSNASRLIQFFMGFFGMKRAMEEKIVNNTYSKVPANIPKSIHEKHRVEVEEFKRRKCWTISPKSSENNPVILYLHGGAYYANITQLHWRFIEQLLIGTNAAFVVPDYPLAPESKCTDTYQFLDAIYEKLISNHHSKQIVFMGDSSGGGLALGFAQKIQKERIKQPQQIILFSPWLDVSMTNPEIVKFDKRDKILNVTGLKTAGKNYAGTLDVTNCRVSPIYGDFSGLGEISVFIGTNEVLIADARKLKQKLEKQQIDFKYYEYPKMFHDWVMVPNLKETNEVIRWITTYFNSMNR